MKQYNDNTGRSGIEAYDYGDDCIQIKFTKGGVYTYCANTIGRENLMQMKQLADSGSGLNSFINKNPIVKNGYE